MNKKRKIGIIGGTFDPVHIGHLILAQSAYEQLKLEKVIFIPAGIPPHKLNRFGGAADIDRLEMTRLAIENNNVFDLDDREMFSTSPTFTYLTIKKMARENPDDEYYFILGEDSLVDFVNWKKPEEIVKYCHIVVGIRLGASDKKIDEIIKTTGKVIGGGDYILIESPAIEISSSDLRKKIRSSKSVKYFIPENVINYINENDIYKE